MALNGSGFWASWKKRARALKVQTFALYFAYRDPRTPWYAKAFTALVVAYAFSPIDLIPDFIPLLGYLDDFVLIPLGVSLAVRMIPAQVMEACQAKAEDSRETGKPEFRAMVAVVIAVWLLALAWVLSTVYRAWKG